jgi:AraC-like DNA-binding protein
MMIERYTPAENLRPFIKAFLVIESETETGMNNRLLPDTSLVMAFRYKGSVLGEAGDIREDLPFAVVSGLRKSARFVNYAENTGNVLVQFKETGAAAFFRQPLHDLFEESLSMDHFVRPRQLSLLEEQLTGAAGNNGRVALIERFLLSRLYDQRPDDLVLAALQKIRLAKGTCKIKDLAGQLYLSQDAFEKRFRKTVGASPKQYASIIRMQSVIRKGPGKLTEAAYEAGYFDQPHFNRDFKSFTGLTPGDFFREPALW